MSEIKRFNEACRAAWEEGRAEIEVWKVTPAQYAALRGEVLGLSPSQDKCLSCGKAEDEMASLCPEMPSGAHVMGSTARMTRLVNPITARAVPVVEMVA